MRPLSAARCRSARAHNRESVEPREAGRAPLLWNRRFSEGGAWGGRAGCGGRGRLGRACGCAGDGDGQACAREGAGGECAGVWAIRAGVRAIGGCARREGGGWMRVGADEARGGETAVRGGRPATPQGRRQSYLHVEFDAKGADPKVGPNSNGAGRACETCRRGRERGGRRQGRGRRRGARGRGRGDALATGGGRRRAGRRAARNRQGAGRSCGRARHPRPPDPCEHDAGGHGQKATVSPVFRLEGALCLRAAANVRAKLLVEGGGGFSILKRE